VAIALGHVITVGWGVVVALLVGGGPHVCRQGRGWPRAVLHMCREGGVCWEGSVVTDPREVHGVARGKSEWGGEARGHVLCSVS